MVLFYVINFNDDERKKRMISRFRTMDIDLQFVEPVYETDSRLLFTDLHKRTSAIMLQHLDSIRHFYEQTSAEYCIVCEDDIHISKDLSKDMPEIIKNFEELKLDLLLLGYLYPHSLDGNWHFPVLKDTQKYNYHGYPDDIWGSQMYLISREHAKNILSKFSIDWAIFNINDTHYNPDWTITKFGKRAVISPMIAVEEGTEKSGHDGQSQFHNDCREANYNPTIHI